jgi:hypothetical protein
MKASWGATSLIGPTRGCVENRSSSAFTVSVSRISYRFFKAICNMLYFRIILGIRLHLLTVVVGAGQSHYNNAAFETWLAL